MTNLQNKVGILCIAPLLALSLSGCGAKQPTEVPGVSDFTLSPEEAQAYLQLKEIAPGPGNRVERTLRTLAERTAMAEVIASLSWTGKAEAGIAIKDQRNELLIERYFDAVTRDAGSDAAVERYYQDNAVRFAARSAHLAHILIAQAPGADEDQLASKRTQAEELARSLAAGGDFAAAAREHSGDLATSTNGGDLGWIGSDSSYRPLIDAVQGLKAGDVSAPVPGERGLHIVKLLEDVKSEPIALESVKEKIRYQLRYDAKLKELDRLRGLAQGRIDEIVKALDLKPAA